MYLLLFTILTVLHTSFAVASENVTCPTIITRSQWGARPWTTVNYLVTPIPYVIIHHTVTPECTTRSKCSARVKNTQSYHMDDLGWSDVGHSFFIGGDNNVYEGAGWDTEGAHTYGYNKKSISIAFIGNYQGKGASAEALEIAHNLIACGQSNGSLRRNVKVIGARQVSSTASPGNKLYEQIQEWSEWASNL